MTYDDKPKPCNVEGCFATESVGKPRDVGECDDLTDIEKGTPGRHPGSI